MENRLTGRCYCGRVVFDVPASLDFGAASRSECSFCRRRAAVMISWPLESLKVQRGDDVLTLYQWDTHTPDIISARYAAFLPLTDAA